MITMRYTCRNNEYADGKRFTDVSARVMTNFSNRLTRALREQRCIINYGAELGALRYSRQRAREMVSPLMKRSRQMWRSFALTL